MSAADKAPAPKSPVAHQATRQLSSSSVPQPDQRPAAAIQRQAQQAINASPRVQQAATLQRALDDRAAAHSPAAPVQREKANRTGLPDELKSGVENLSGHSLDDVRVHYNSAQPAEMQAHAYAQGTDIHVAPGQEQHLPHEAWHVAQQKQGRVKPTMQLKAGVPVNDDAGLEKEADVMGKQALAAPVATTQRQLVRTTGAAPVQRVKNESKRAQLDSRMESLKSEATGLLRKMMTEGQNWERAYAEKGKAKGLSILDGEKTDYPAEALKAALKEGWKQLTPAQKWEMLLETGKFGSRAVGTAARGVGKVASGLSVLSSESEAREQESRKPKPREQREERPDGEPSESLLDGLTLEQLQAAHRAYSLINKGLKKYGEAKDAVRKKGGEVGEYVGAEVGKLRDEWDFDSRMDAFRQEFISARHEYELLKTEIEENEDYARYSQELDALLYGLKNTLNGPAQVYFLGGLTETGRKRYAEVCRNALAAIERSRRDIGFFETLGSVTSMVVKAVSDVADRGEGERARVGTAQNELASALDDILNKSWANRTKWRSMPTTVSAIKQALPAQQGATAKLNAAVSLAAAAQSQASSNRSDETRRFYKALAKLNVNDFSSLVAAKGTLESIGKNLG